MDQLLPGILIIGFSFSAVFAFVALLVLVGTIRRRKNKIKKNQSKTPNPKL